MNKSKITKKKKKKTYKKRIKQIIENSWEKTRPGYNDLPAIE